MCGDEEREGFILWVHVRHRKVYQKVLEHIRRYYQYMTPSHNMNDTFLIQNSNNPSEKIRALKLLMGCSL